MKINEHDVYICDNCGEYIFNLDTLIGYRSDEYCGNVGSAPEYENICPYCKSKEVCELQGDEYDEYLRYLEIQDYKNLPHKDGEWLDFQLLHSLDEGRYLVNMDTIWGNQVDIRMYNKSRWVLNPGEKVVTHWSLLPQVVKTGQGD